MRAQVSLTEIQVGFPAPPGSSQTPDTPVPGNPTPSSDPAWHWARAYCTYVHVGKYSYTKQCKDCGVLII